MGCGSADEVLGIAMEQKGTSIPQTVSPICNEAYGKIIGNNRRHVTKAAVRRLFQTDMGISMAQTDAASEIPITFSWPSFDLHHSSIMPDVP